VINRDTFAVEILSQSNVFDSVVLICPNQQTYLEAYVIGSDYYPITYYWSSGGNQSYINGADTGTYSVTIYNSLGCSTTSSVNIRTRTTTAPIITAQGPTTFCSGGSVLLTATHGYQSYNWNNVSPSRTGDSAVALYGTTTFVETTDSFGCNTVSNSITVQVDYGPTQPSVTTLGCDLISSNQHGNQWEVNGSPLADTTQILTPRTSGLFTVTTTDSLGCSSTSSQIPYQLLARPVITADGPVEFCNGGSVLLTVTPATSFVWSNGDSVHQNILVKQSGTYTATVTNGTCVQTTTPLEVIVDSCTTPQQPGMILDFAASPNAVCIGSRTNLEWNTSNAVSGFITSSDSTSSVFFALSGITSVVIHQTTEFTLTIIDGNSDTTRQSVTVFADSCNTATGIQNLAESTNILLFPNPVTTTLHIENIPNQLRDMAILSVTGDVIATEKITNTNTTIDVSNLAAGIYFLRLDEKTFKKFVKQ
jgi:hypothetical protein